MQLAESTGAVVSSNLDGHVHLIFQSVEISGFCSFGTSPQTYSFVAPGGSDQGRGLVLIEGRFGPIDGMHTVPEASNGAGKTSLAMATLWA